MERSTIGEIDKITVKNNKASFSFTPMGATVLSYIPKNGQELFWLGNYNSFKNGVAIRGGIPICFPRFGLEELNSHFDKHGFARNETWVIDNIEESDDLTVIALSLNQSAKYSYAVTLRLKITLSDYLEMELEALNIGDANVSFSEALHTYFTVGNINDITIEGLAGANYYDEMDDFKVKKHTDDKLVVNQFIDRIFFNNENPVKIVDSNLKRVIHIEKKGALSTIVWNPYQRALGDEVNETDYQNFVCVEAGNVNNNAVTLKPGEKHKLVMRVWAAPLQ
ncbi:MAG: D-hexose-6-phosphate mutarotase [Spirochaetaceae bacterium]|nr:D-hexose-6-phosphate mutarotase [Spirochaetaceae bacterium]